MVLHGYLGGILHLIQVLLVQLCQGGGGHGAGGADFRLAAAFRAGDGGVALGQIADDAGGGQSTADLFIGKALGQLGIFQHGGEHAAGTAGGSGDDGTVIGVLLGYGVGKGGNLLEFAQGGHFGVRGLLVEILGLSLNVQTSRQHAGGGKPFVNGTLHHLPDFHEEIPDFRAFVQLHVFTQGVDIAPFAEVRDFGKGMLDIHLFLGIVLSSGNTDVTAADGLHPY